MRKRRHKCLLCGGPATLADQVFFTNCGKPMTVKTAQVRAVPTICLNCASTKLRTSPIVVDSYDECRRRIVEIANSEGAKTTILLFDRGTAKENPCKSD